MKIYGGNFKVLDFLIIRLAGIPFGLIRKCDENAYESWKSLIDKCEVSDEKQ